jgi:aryl-alcohol dehydrogenase-like predicted oxidoreductase
LRSDFRAHAPRFHGENLARNRRLVDSLAQLAASRGVSVARLAIAWVPSRGDDIVPIVGTRRRDRLADSLRALDVALSADDVAAIERALPEGAVAGDRYAPAGMAQLGSERAPTASD